MSKVKNNQPKSLYQILTSSSIGMKLVMAGTGILLYLFLLGHLAGNTLLYVSKEAFNAYSDALTSTWLIYIVEFGLVAIFLLHIFSAIKLSIANRKARPEKYHLRKTAGGSTVFSRYMLHSGMIILIFVVLHVISFKFGDWDNRLITSKLTLYDHVIESFAFLPYSAFYVFCMIFLGFHLHHAFKSALATLGLVRISTINKLTNLSCGLSIFLSAGFCSFPVYFYLQSIWQ